MGTECPVTVAPLAIVLQISKLLHCAWYIRGGRTCMRYGSYQAQHCQQVHGTDDRERLET